ncbi:MAG: hypothetical protein A2268_00880 [Candidatus Raymondbacteria bacterium RifOxyA12_full_50_37]|uniref:Fibronectin type-III domain-containing protein n=1 Tax=Candidatus Raymondbacteria bacterium RIFOXYD12_FULL_49_13 TaxID=1817890 RepID=A0A1F7FFV9_UNCRA|nr:MAG: hypothetical protein A2268_00880 [Candidatus Raymondbacteria bacterium RifOxyA12_full_50_37]OGJ86357.1 MAG: hypothetical protein A2248_13845 [Candidatus Raymondbacteria bacterium RIFOXYA2_FULL_49_16]OGJ95527.1 MAG: hypothetical protein A2453_12620 [Candidatus Raymondbacteria bacterium RIFOXYC2_FULL_50_21]OGJ96110.1 MAG: hypothetical protein A2487_01765 [Candidatus Raymondbacteria bacterium RifOxyC12_full_50_8]OGJ96262.1 MAG: hypothetical protein A2350_02350 [Candidatus Raymondbacteria b
MRKNSIWLLCILAFVFFSCTNNNPVDPTPVNNPPIAPICLAPSDSALNQEKSVTLTWRQAIDPDGDSVRYDVYFGTDIGQLAIIGASISDTTYAVTKLIFNTVYYWKITAKDGNSTASSPVRRFTVKSYASPGMKLIHAGSFLDKDSNTATISYDFWMDSTEITVSEFKDVMDTAPAPSYFRESSGKYPVDYITWFQMIMYCNARSRLNGLDTVYTYTSINFSSANNLVCDWTRNGLRLPTEDEWELTARGAAQMQYPTFDGTISCANANYYGCKEPPSSVEAASFMPNPSGIYDLAGNVWEWCWNIDEDTVRQYNRTDYTGAESGSNRIMKGGGYSSTSVNAGSRIGWASSKHTYGIGFRVVRLAN